VSTQLGQLNSASVEQRNADVNSDYGVHDRSLNLIIFGIAENRDANVWRRRVDDIFQHVSGKMIDVTDMFRIGGDVWQARSVLC